MRYKLKALCLFSATLAALAAVPLVASAQQLAYTSKEVSLRAGPSRDYPVVATLGAGTTMTIFGCLQDYRWCDVVVGGSRGWVYSGNIVYPYLGRNLPVMSYGSTIGLGIVSFSIDNYWGNYYTDYPWYPLRQSWDSRSWAGYGSGYGSGYNWHAPTAQVRPVTSAIRPPAQVRPVAPQRQQTAPLRAPPAQVQGVGSGQAQQCGPNDANCGRARQGTH